MKKLPSNLPTFIFDFSNSLAVVSFKSYFFST